MTYGLIMVFDATKLEESAKRLFRKKRGQLKKRIGLEKVTRGVYFLPFEKGEPSKEEINAFDQLNDLLKEHDVGVRLYVATQVEHTEETWVPPGTTSPPDSLTSAVEQVSKLKTLFVLKPIKAIKEE